MPNETRRSIQNVGAPLLLELYPSRSRYDERKARKLEVIVIANMALFMGSVFLLIAAIMVWRVSLFGDHGIIPDSVYCGQ
jgi:uncharacterized membrane protein